MPKHDPAKLKSVKVSIPFGIGAFEWQSDPTERRAAWELYIELKTRIGVEQMKAGEGTLREALGSLHSLFGSTRDILRKAGPNVGASPKSVGGIAIQVLNKGLRPFLSYWHPQLQAWETQTAADAKKHEKDWPQSPELRKALEKLGQELEQYAAALAKIAGVAE